MPYPIDDQIPEVSYHDDHTAHLLFSQSIQGIDDNGYAIDGYETFWCPVGVGA